MQRKLAVSMAILISLAIAARSHAAPATRPATVKVAAVQCSSDLGAVEANRQKLMRLAEQAADNGAKIIVLPEAAITGYLSQDLRTNWRLPGRPLNPAFIGKDPHGFAETVPGPSTEQFAALAKRLGVYITVPLIEIDTAPAIGPTTRPAAPPADNAERFFNTVCLVSPEGKLVAHYRKLHPWPHPEQSWATTGDRGVVTYDTEFGRVGLAICYDIHEILEQYRPHKIWALLYPIAWVDWNHPADWFWHRLPPRVAKYNHYLIGANWSVDDRQPWFGYGFSTIIAPDGKILATAHSLYGSEIIYAEIKTQPGR